MEIYKINYELITSNDQLRQRLINDKYWVFSWVVEDPKNVNDPDLFTRINIKNNSLYLIKQSNDQDYTKTGLNPRTELRLEHSNYRLSQNQKYRVTLINKITKNDFSAEFFQVMGKNDSNQSKPTFQIEARQGKFSVRHCDWTQGQNLIINYLDDISKYLNRWLQWDIEFLLSNSSSQGFIKVYLDGKQVFEKKLQTIWSNSSKAWIQYGVYANHSSAISMEAYVKSISINTITQSNPNPTFPISSIIPTPVPVTPTPVPVTPTPVPVTPTPVPVTPTPVPVPTQSNTYKKIKTITMRQLTLNGTIDIFYRD